MKKRNLVGLLLGIQGVLILFFFLLLATKQHVASLAGTPNSAIPQILFTGDVMLGRHVETLMDRYGGQYPFEKISNVLGQYTTVINLEGPIPYEHTKTPDFTTSFSFKSDYTNFLAMNGVDFATLANNHTFDKGVDNFENTKNVMFQSGVPTFGHPREIGKESFLVFGSGDKKTYFVGFNDAVSEYFDPSKAVELVKALRSVGDKNLIFVYIHWGNEYQLTSSKKQQALAHALIDNGADAVIGHHPHVVQEVEMYEGKPIFYSLGNLIFDQYFSKDTQEGLMVLAETEPDLIKYSLLPVDIIKSQPALKSVEHQAEFLENLAARSDEEIQAQVRLGTITVGR